MNRRARPDWRLLLAGLAHLVDLGDVDPVAHVVVDVVEHHVDPLRRLSPRNLDRHLLDEADPRLPRQVGDDLDDLVVDPAPLPLPGMTSGQNMLAPLRLDDGPRV